MAPGWQTPTHMPATHAYGQSAGVPQFPFESHVCTAYPEHRVWAGVHTPTQRPLTQAWEPQSMAGPHWPFELHVWTALPWHWAAPASPHAAVASAP